MQHPGRTHVRSRPLSEAETAQVQQQLDRMLDSPSFRASPRCQQLLRYLVEHLLADREEFLRERVIGAEVFGRTPSYDTGEDSIVRVRANDVRRRLAQYYDSTPGREHEVRILLPVGQYVPELAFPIQEPPPAVPVSAPAPPPRSPWRFNRIVMAAVLLGSALALFGWRYLPVAQTAVDMFWAPVFASSKPVILCLGHSQIFSLSKQFRDNYFSLHPRSSEPDPPAVTLSPEQVLHGRDLVSMQGQFVGVGGAQSVQMFASLLGAHGKSSYLRSGNELSYADLKDHPTVLIGAFSNRWTLRLNRQLRYYFDESTGRRICDRTQPSRFWELELDANDREKVDYAVVWRLLHSETGEVVIGASGITQYGCTAAGELLTNTAYLTQALRQAPVGWEKKNLQIVLRSKIVGLTAGPPEVLAVHFW